MITVSPLVLPIINSIIHAAEEQISELCRCSVTLSMQVQLEHQKRPVTVEYLKEVVCEHFHVTWGEIHGTRRKAEIVIARHSYCYLADRFLKRSSIQIGSDINRDHSAVLHAIKSINERLETKDAKVCNILKKILLRIQNEKSHEQVQDKNQA